MEYCSGLKRKEVLTQKTMWMGLENMLSERSQTPKAIEYDPIYMKYPEEANPERRKQISCQGLGME